MISENSDDCLLTVESSSPDEKIVVKRVKREQSFLQAVAKFNDVQFKTHFRVSKLVANRITEQYNVFLKRRDHGGRQKIGTECEIYIMLWYLATTETYRQISERFNITESSVHRILYRTIEWMVKESENYIKWPTPIEMRKNQDHFAMMLGLPGVVGAIGCSHIKINPRQNHRTLFFNKEKDYSVLLQGIVNVDNKFIDIHCGEPGSTLEDELLQKSGIYERINENESLIIPGGVLLGDSSYAGSRYLVTPFINHENLTAKQRKFNFLHSGTRIVVENAFYLLKSRFRRIKLCESPNIAFVNKYIVAACVLHNICIDENDTLDIVYFEDEFEAAQNSIYSGINKENNKPRDEMFKNVDRKGLLS